MTRDNWFDGLKFVLIFLVIFGHCRHFTVSDESLLSSKIVRYMIHTVYLFHMPLFILISGYFSKKTSKEIFKKSIIRLLKIFLLFHFLWFGLDSLRGEDFSITRLISPSFTLWYLLSLIYWRAMLQHIPQKYDRACLILPITAILAVSGGGLPLVNEFSIPRTFTFMPLFFLGYYAKKHNWLETIRKPSFLWFVIPAVVLIVIENSIHLDFYGRKPYVGLNDVIKRMVFLFSSIIISIAFVRVLPSKISVFAGEGKDVLFYYIYHSFVLFAIAMLLIQMNCIVGGFGLIFVSLFTLGILFMLRRIKLLHMLIK